MEADDLNEKLNDICMGERIDEVNLPDDFESIEFYHNYLSLEAQLYCDDGFTYDRSVRLRDLDILLTKISAGNLSDGESEKLMELLQDQECLKIYQDYLDLESQLLFINDKSLLRSKSIRFFLLAAAAVITISCTIYFVMTREVFQTPEIVAQSSEAVFEGSLNQRDSFILSQGAVEIKMKNTNLLLKAPADFQAVDNYNVKLNKGVLYLDIDRKGKGFKVKTNTAVVETLGTQFMVQAGVGFTEVEVNSGTVSAEAQSKKILVSKNSGVILKKDVIKEFKTDSPKFISSIDEYKTIIEDAEWTGLEDSKWANKKNWNPEIVPTGIVKINSGEVYLSRQFPVKKVELTSAGKGLEVSGGGLYFAKAGELVYNYLGKSLEGLQNEKAIISSEIIIEEKLKVKNKNKWHVGGETLVLAGEVIGTGDLIIEENTTELKADNRNFEGEIVIKGNLLASNKFSLGNLRGKTYLNNGTITWGDVKDTFESFIVSGKSKWSAVTTSGPHGGSIKVLEGSSLEFDNGGGNESTMTSLISGKGDVIVSHGRLSFKGRAENTLSGSWIIDCKRDLYRVVSLARKGGHVISSDFSVGTFSILQWEEDEQVLDTAPMTVLENSQDVILKLNGHKEILGSLSLRGDLNIELKNGELYFAESNNQAWDMDKKILIKDWTKRSVIKFGSNNKSLTEDQLNCIIFLDAEGVPGNSRAAIDVNGVISPKKP